MSRESISVVIPARNAGREIGAALQSVFEQRVTGALEVIVVDDGSTDDTVSVAEQFPCRIERIPGSLGNPARARNIGAKLSGGDPIVFMDADCLAQPNWLAAILNAHAQGHAVVGGAVDMPAGMPFTARCDYYCGCYLIHGGRPRQVVPHHPPPNLSFGREAFFRSGGFSERWPLYYTNEEREPLAKLRAAGDTVLFEPDARVRHRNRAGVKALLRRHYRWGYTAIESKHITRSARLAWLYRWPMVAAVLSPALATAQSAMIAGLWLRAGEAEILLHIPLIALSRGAYALGMTMGALDWRRRRSRNGQTAKRWTNS
jgi:glycosyltransferase involved in cell wall biosynthesis